ncbi:MFS transporter [Bacillus amyloliquefaciens]|uniref:MFS transporter n=1 Tax=Bacillus amyloliquefaciens TaxID=1390 RepID=A0AAP7TBD3_BACAM|nr:MFS transporter [Bacillus amyloliquefaciens]OIK21071.1 MFS transporter [Bacillus amyloliquefaciens]
MNMRRAYYSILYSQTAVNLGFSLYTMAVILFLFTKTGSTAMASLMTFVSIVFRVVGSAVLPLVTGRFTLRSLLIGSQLIQVILLVCLFYVIQTGSSAFFFLLFCLIGGISFCNGWFAPVKSALIGEIIPPDQRVKANGLLSAADQTVQFAGWSLGGVIIAFLGESYTIIITVMLLVSSVLGIILFLQVHMCAPPEAVRRRSLFASAASGWVYLFRQKQLRILIVMDVIESWAGMIWIGSVSLTYVHDVLHKGEAWWGYVNGVYYAGTMLGGLIIYRLSGKFERNLIPFMLTGALAYGMFTFIYGLISSAVLALFLVLCMGPACVLRDLTQETFLQNITTEQTRVNILAARSALVQFIFMFSIIGTGVISDVFGVRFIYVGAGLLLLFSVIIGFSQLQMKKTVQSRM